MATHVGEMVGLKINASPSTSTIGRKSARSPAAKRAHVDDRPPGRVDELEAAVNADREELAQGLGFADADDLAEHVAQMPERAEELRAHEQRQREEQAAREEAAAHRQACRDALLVNLVNWREAIAAVERLTPQLEAHRLEVNAGTRTAESYDRELVAFEVAAEKASVARQAIAQFEARAYPDECMQGAYDEWRAAQTQPQKSSGTPFLFLIAAALLGVF